MITGSYATAINCIDGRVQEPVTQWMLERFKVDFIDKVNVPGPDKVLSEGSQDAIEELRRKVQITVDVHKSEYIAVAGHQDCAGNPASDEEHHEQIKKSVEVIKGWGFNLPVVGLWVNENRDIEVVCE